MPLAGGIFCPNFDLSAEPKAEGSSVKISLIETGEKRFKRFFFQTRTPFFCHENSENWPFDEDAFESSAVDNSLKPPR